MLSGDLSLAADWLRRQSLLAKPGRESMRLRFDSLNFGGCLRRQAGGRSSGPRASRRVAASSSFAAASG